MKLAITVLAMGLCTSSAASHAWPAGTIHFMGSIVHQTCADAVAVNRSPAPRHVPNRCTPGATGVGGSGNAPVYAEHMTMVSGRSGIEVLDYYIDIVRSGSGGQVRVLTRDYM
jgi:type 1 fimbria pilin